MVDYTFVTFEVEKALDGRFRPYRVTLLANGWSVHDVRNCRSLSSVKWMKLKMERQFWARQARDRERKERFRNYKRIE